MLIGEYIFLANSIALKIWRIPLLLTPFSTPHFERNKIDYNSKPFLTLSYLSKELLSLKETNKRP